MKKVLLLSAVLLSIAFAVSATPTDVNPTSDYFTLYGNVLNRNAVTVSVYQQDATGEYNKVGGVSSSEYYEIKLDPTESYIIWFKNIFDESVLVKVDLGRAITASTSFDINIKGFSIDFYELTISGAIVASNGAFPKPSDIESDMGALGKD